MKPLRVFSVAWLMSFVSLCEAVRETFKQFSDCDLPIEIHIDRRNEYEISTTNNTSLVMIGGSSFLVNPPFKSKGTNVLILDSCLDFVLKIFYPQGSEQQDDIHYKCLPCNRRTELIIGLTTLLVLVGAAVCVYFFCRKKSRERRRRGGPAGGENDL